MTALKWWWKLDALMSSSRAVSSIRRGVQEPDELHNGVQQPASSGLTLLALTSVWLCGEK